MGAISGEREIPSFEKVWVTPFCDDCETWPVCEATTEEYSHMEMGGGFVLIINLICGWPFSHAFSFPEKMLESDAKPT